MERRGFLRDTLFSIVGITFTPQPKNKPAFRDAERALSDIANKLERLNLANPSNMEKAHHELEAAIQLAEKGLNSEITELYQKSFRQIDRLRISSSHLDSVQNTNPQLIDRIEAVETVLPYYRSIERVLHTSKNVCKQVKLIDGAVLEENPDRLVDDANKLKDLVTTDLTLEDLRETTTSLIDSGNPTVANLTPDMDNLLAELEVLQQVLSSYATALVGYSESTQLLEEGIIEREEAVGDQSKNFEKAENLFQRASTKTDIKMSSRVQQYSIDATTFSLGQYQSLVTHLNNAAGHLLQSCRNTDDENLESLQAARRLIIEARRLAESSR